MGIHIVSRTCEDVAEAKFHYHLVDSGNESLVPVFLWWPKTMGGL